jgi:hypothetical protein
MFFVVSLSVFGSALSLTPLPSNTSRPPAPTRPPRPTGPAIRINYTDEYPTFNVFGTDGNATVLSAYNGYAAHLRFGKEGEDVPNGKTLEISNVFLSVHGSVIAPNTAVVAIKLRNENPFPAVVNVSIENDVRFDGNDWAPVWGLPGQRGFIIYSPNHTMTWALRSYTLVDDVTTYWFGPWGDIYESNWTQVQQEDFSGADSAMAFSWQELSIPARSILTRSVIAKFGNFETGNISLDLVFEGAENENLEYRSTVTARGHATGRGVGLAKIVAVVDDDRSAFFTVLERVRLNGTLNFTFAFVDFGVAQGGHTLSFYIVDEDGNVGGPVTLTTFVLAPTPTSSRSTSPYPSHTPAPTDIAIEVGEYQNGFNVSGLAANGTGIRTSYSGYYLQVRVDGQDTVEAGSWGVTDIHGIVATFHLTVISKNAALLAFKIKNTASTARVVDLAIASDVFFDGDDKARCSEIEPLRGFVISSNSSAFAFILRGYPLVSDVSTFWYGVNWDRYINYWTQVREKCSPPDDSGCSFSWQGIGVRPGRETTRSCIVKFGVFQPSTLTLTLSTENINPPIYYKDLVLLSGKVSGVDQAVDVLCVVDDPTFSFRINNVTYNETTASVTVPLRLVDYGVGQGTHQFSFYAVDSSGSVSPLNGNSFVAAVVAPTSTPTASVSSSYSPTPSPTPFLDVAIRVTDHYSLSFDVVGELNDEQIQTGGGWGYLAGFRVGNEVVELRNSEPAVLRGLELTVSHNILSRNAALVSLHLSNSGSDELVDFGVAIDINLHWVDNAPVVAIGNRLGFSVISYDCKVTYVTGNYPLVDPVTSYWYGEYYDRYDLRWTQVREDSFSGRDSACSFAWQDVLVRSGQTVVKSVIIKFGEFEYAQLNLTLSASKGEVVLNEAVEIRGSIQASGQESTIRFCLIVDGDLTTFRHLPESRNVNSDFRFDFVPQDQSIVPGKHSLTFCAVDAYGDLSNVVSIGIKVVVGAGESSKVGVIAGSVVGVSAAVVIAVVVVVVWLRKTRVRYEATAVGGDVEDASTGTVGLKEYMADDLLPD